ncbi:CheR family methyltransferase [Pseudoalteromonas sp. T1lg65]|uniref:CheR family methyltransferase n=1 Tax=Pseudoalteromonas sp. T1lg65 TaxID=2077101 RepID=UPI003F7AE42A
MREFLLTDDDFSTISAKVYETCGIVLGPHKREMIYSRLARRIRANGLNSFSHYLQFLEEHTEEFSHFINAITTNLTSFFREKHHFDFLLTKVIPEVKARHRVDKRVRIWSAGCSTGEEPYTIAMTIANAFPRDWDVKILATDLDSNVLARGSAGEYNAKSITGLGPDMLKDFFLKSPDGGTYKVKPALQKLIHFKRLNLLETWPMKGPFDFIFCRNVLIYFDKETKERLFDGFRELLVSDGYLFIGHSETMGKDTKGFKNLGKTIYQKALI